MSRPPGHERSAWATSTAEAHVLCGRSATAALFGPTPLRTGFYMGRFRDLDGHLAGLAFRAAELVYDAEQRADAAERRADAADHALHRFWMLA